MMLSIAPALSRLRDVVRALRSRFRSVRGCYGEDRGQRPDTYQASFSSRAYWKERYRSGRDSGPGSRGRLALFKAEFLNRFVAEHEIDTVIEFGCGDGQQLVLAQYPRYWGFDVSEEAVACCRRIFADDQSKTFGSLDEYDGRVCDLALSLDVVYHLVEDEVFEAHMRVLTSAARRFVIVYSTNRDEPASASAPHVRHRRFTDWMLTNRPDWVLSARVPNKYPFEGDYATGSDAEFFVFTRAG